MISLKSSNFIERVNEWVQVHDIERTCVKGASFVYQQFNYNVTATRNSADKGVTTLYIRIMNQSSCYVFFVTDNKKVPQLSINCSEASIPDQPDYDFLVEFINHSAFCEWSPVRFQGVFDQKFYDFLEPYDVLLPPNLRDYNLLRWDHPDLADLLRTTNLSQHGEKGVSIDYMDRRYTLSTSYSFQEGTKKLILFMKVLFQSFKYTYTLPPSKELRSVIPQMVETDLHLTLLRRVNA